MLTALDNPTPVAVFDLLPNNGAQLATVLATFYKTSWTDLLSNATVLGDIVQQRLFCGDWMSPDPWSRRMHRSAKAIQLSICGACPPLSGAAYSVYCALGAYLVFSEWFARHYAFQLVSALLPPGGGPAFWENEHVSPRLQLAFVPGPDLRVICDALQSLDTYDLRALTNRLQSDAQAADSACGSSADHWKHYLLKKQPFLVAV
jgi:hypothetical protein